MKITNAKNQTFDIHVRDIVHSWWDDTKQFIITHLNTGNCGVVELKRTNHQSFMTYAMLVQE